MLYQRCVFPGITAFATLFDLHIRDLWMVNEEIAKFDQMTLKCVRRRFEGWLTGRWNMGTDGFLRAMFIGQLSASW